MVLSSILLGALAVTPVLGQSWVDRFEQFDRNDDGVVTSQEVSGAAWFGRLLKRADDNRDGKLQRGELTAIADRTRRRNQPFERIPKAPPHRKVLDVEYHKVDGVDPNLLSLDLYVPIKPTVEPHPVMIMIHGGGWRAGDKSNISMTGAKMPHFLNHGYIYVTINYRLSPSGPGEPGVQHPVHADDCARALAWLHDNIAQYGGDRDQLHLMGHSAGAHLAALVATNDRFLKRAGKDLSIIKTNVLLDTAAINVPGYLDDVGERGLSTLYANAFGTKRETLVDASPFHHVKAQKAMPPTILFYGGDRMGLHRYGPEFTQAMTSAGSPSRAIDTIDLDHSQINRSIGMPDDAMTKLIMRLHAGEDASTFPEVLPGKVKRSAGR